MTSDAKILASSASARENAGVEGSSPQASTAGGSSPPGKHRSAALAHPADLAAGRVHEPARCLDRQYRDPVDSAEPRRKLRRRPVGACRVHACLRAGPDHRRPARRHVRAQAAVPDRRRRLHSDVRAVRSRTKPRSADRLPRGARRYGRDHDPAGARGHPGAFRTCLHDRLVATDPTATPASCRLRPGSRATGRQAASTALPAASKHAIAGIGKKATAIDFAASLERTLFFQVGVFVFSFLLMLALPRMRRAEPATTDA